MVIYQLCFQMLAVVLLIATKKKQQQEERDGRTSNPMMRMTSLLSKENQTRVSTIYVGGENCIFYFAKARLLFLLYNVRWLEPPSHNDVNHEQTNFFAGESFFST